jgi:hypothetical protein
MNSIEVRSRDPRNLTAAVCVSDVAHRSQPWYQAYMAALFESEKKSISERICHAEKLMIARERAIFGQAVTETERSALDRAFHALRALEFCLKGQPEAYLRRAKT